jgi:eukaryotic-like serine/threonine-protein kinase
MVTVGQVIGTQASGAGPYRVVRPLAAGGLGGVWLATDETTGEPVAIKRCELPAGLTPDEQDLFRMWTVREARAYARVRHPNVIRTRAVLTHDDGPWIVMEYVPSRSLQQVIDASGTLPPARVAGIGLAVAQGLAAVRRAGLLHLDVKPGNVLLADDGRVVLSDFGPAVTVDGVRALALAGIILGSPKYLAPERLTGGVASPESDLWSLGATLYHAVEGRPPFDRPTTVDTLLALAEQEPDPPVRAGPLTPVIVGLLQRDPAARPGPERVAEQLRGVLRRPGRSGGRRRLTGFLNTGPGRRRGAVLVAGLAVAVAVVVALPLTRPAAAPQRPAVVAASSPAPHGFVWYDHPTLYRVAVPAGWPRRTEADGVVLTGPRGGPTLRLTTGPAPADPVAALIARERGTPPAAYRRIRIERLPESRDAFWEFRYDERAGTVHAWQRIFVTGRFAVTLDWRTGSDDWPRHLAELTTVVDSFTSKPAR